MHYTSDFILLTILLNSCSCESDKLVRCEEIPDSGGYTYCNPPTPSEQNIDYIPTPVYPPPESNPVENCNPECCNGVDDNGNGLIDEKIPPGSSCYDGPPESEGVGPCIAGAWLCRSGSWVCVGQVLPAHEEGLDQNCDGYIPAIFINLVLVVDVTTSNSQWGLLYFKKGIINALTYIKKFGTNAPFRVSLVKLAYPDNSWTVVNDIGATIDDVITSVENLSYTGGGLEPSYTLLQKICNNELINWSPVSYKVIDIFADEIGQPNLDNEKIVAQICKNNKVKVTIWTDYYTTNIRESYDEIGTVENWSQNTTPEYIINYIIEDAKIP